MMSVSLGLVHWPIKNRKGEKVATSVTNLDIHDIARVCRSYEVKNYYIINRLKEQQIFVRRVLDYWAVGYGQKFNPMRKTALGMVKTADQVEDAVKDLGGAFIVSTAARSLKEMDFGSCDKEPASAKKIKSISFRELQEKIKNGQPSENLLLLFGTGFGLHESLILSSDALLEPIWGASSDQYRHLSVRSAVSICLDRLKGTW